MPSLDVYRPIVQASGLEIVRLELVPRDVVHEGHAGLAGWIRTTWMPYTDRLPDDRRAAWIDEVVERYAERVPADAEGRLHVPSFRVELEAIDRPIRAVAGQYGSERSFRPLESARKTCRSYAETSYRKC